MNAIEDNPFTQALTALGRQLPKPKAILCISAHWYLSGIWVTRMEQPKTLHDFSGFPEALDQVEYPAPGSPDLANRVIELVPGARADDVEWGLDHGTWAVLRFLFPEANIPVVQLSYDLKQPAAYHFEIGTRLKTLREEEVLVMASGNIVHNLRQIDWKRDAPAYPWAIEFDNWVRERIDAKDTRALVDDFLSTEAGKLSVPRPDHYYPLLYVLGASEKRDSVSYPFEGFQNASISMRTVLLERKAE